MKSGFDQLRAVRQVIIFTDQKFLRLPSQGIKIKTRFSKIKKVAKMAEPRVQGCLNLEWCSLEWEKSGPTKKLWSQSERSERADGAKVDGNPLCHRTRRSPKTLSQGN